MEVRKKTGTSKEASKKAGMSKEMGYHWFKVDRETIAEMKPIKVLKLVTIMKFIPWYCNIDMIIYSNKYSYYYSGPLFAVTFLVQKHENYYVKIFNSDIEDIIMKKGGVER